MQPTESHPSNNENSLVRAIEAVLFWKAEPVSKKELARLLKTGEREIEEALDSLETSLKGRGLALVRTDTDAMLGTSPEMSPIIEAIAKEELSRDLGKAGLETLSIILYQGPISRSDIDYIRGVNSQFIVRNLLVRGLIERVENPADLRSFLYKPTIALLQHIGLSKMEDLPEWEKVREEIDSFRQREGNTGENAGTGSEAEADGTSDHFAEDKK